MTLAADPIETVRARLDALGRKITGCDDNFLAQCPAHDDDTPSLHVSVGDNGGAILHCFAGCTTESVRERLLSKSQTYGLPCSASCRSVPATTTAA